MTVVIQIQRPLNRRSGCPCAPRGRAVRILLDGSEVMPVYSLGGRLSCLVDRLSAFNKALAHEKDP
jgi:hypothetical protein